MILFAGAFDMSTLFRQRHPIMGPDRIRRIHTRIRPFLRDSGELFLAVSVEEQALYACAGDRIVERFDASTSRFGLGGRENSLRTPLGLHRIREKYGQGAPAGRVFRDREDTGEDWDHTLNGDNLILTRILRLEGLEQGVNRGPGVDSYERYIYIHGTGREDLIGTPLSHGCVCLRNNDVIRLFDLVREGTVVHIDPPPVMINGRPCRSIHFTGIFGSGMSGLAQYLRFQGIPVSGSDRFHASGDTASLRSSLESLGCSIVPQDGSGVFADTDVVCVSTAIEEGNPDLAAARQHDIPVVHRSDVLAALIASKRTIAVAGTSGKSTVTAMIFEFLTACGHSPSLLSGAGLRRLERQGAIGNAWSGGSDLLVVEADESDGTVVKYRPEAAVILNVSRDHKGVDEVAGMLGTLASRAAWSAVNADDAVLSSLPAAVRFGRNGSASWRPDHEELLPGSVRLVRKGVEYHLPLPGEHNLENLRAALCVCERYGCEPHVLAEAVRGFEGVARRFSVTRTAKGVIVVDDFAHNPAKIAAAVKAARGLSPGIIAVYQPHGFGPTRFLKDDYISAFRSSFRENDALYLLPIYYAGGTATKDISSQDLVAGLGPVPFPAEAVADRDELIAKLASVARPGDCVIIMGARDPSLPFLTTRMIDAFGGEIPTRE
jgi:UDP-N-acetylmuramate--alanine ligase